jgi:hypothetical protein
MLSSTRISPPHQQRPLSLPCCRAMMPQHAHLVCLPVYSLESAPRIQRRIVHKPSVECHALHDKAAGFHRFRTFHRFALTMRGLRTAGSCVTFAASGAGFKRCIFLFSPKIPLLEVNIGVCCDDPLLLLLKILTGRCSDTCTLGR